MHYIRCKIDMDFPWNTTGFIRVHSKDWKTKVYRLKVEDDKPYFPWKTADDVEEWLPLSEEQLKHIHKIQISRKCFRRNDEL